MQMTANLDSVFAYNAGIPKLSFNLKVKNDTDKPLAVLNVIAEVRAAASSSISDIHKSAYFIGYGVLESGGGQFSPGSEDHWRLGLPLHPYEIQKIEEVRKAGDGDLFFHIYFFCTAVLMEKPGTSPLVGMARVDIRGPASSSNYCPFKIAQSDWTKMLRDLGYGSYFLMEIPLRGVPAKRGMEKALEHLKGAWAHFEEGNDDETLASCYKAFEYLAKKRKVKDPDQNAFERLLDNVADDEKRRRLKMLMDYVCRFLCLGRHEPGIEAVYLDEKDSEYGLILCQATLAYLAKSMKQSPSK